MCDFMTCGKIKFVISPFPTYLHSKAAATPAACPHTTHQAVITRMGQANEVWKRLFFLLYNNREPDDDLPTMWTSFKAVNLQYSDLETAIESIGHLLQEDVKEKVSSLFIAEETDTANLLNLMKEDSLLEDDFWYLLFRAVRDRSCGPIDDNMKICILEGGQTKQMTMGEIEDKFISENRDSFKSQACVPDQMIHEDVIDAFLSTSSVKDSLKRSYEEKLAEMIETQASDNPKLKKEEVEKQAAAQAKKEVKGSSEAKSLQNREAMMAEHEVQKSIKRAMVDFGIPVYIFRGVNTYDDVGRFLGSLGFKMSRLKAFKTGEATKTLECEHDIATVALLPCGPLVSFAQVKIYSIFANFQIWMQVKTNEADTPWDPKAEDQKVDGKLFKEGVDQLERDVLRFLELTPDISMSDVRIVTNMAFPLASEPSERALTKDDFLSKNAPLLLEKLGVPKKYLELPEMPMINPKAEESFKRIICRYLGAHTTVQWKVSMDQGVKALDLAVTGTECGYEAHLANPTLQEVEHVGDIRKAVARDARMREIRNAVLVPKFGKKFQLKNVNIPLSDLKADKEQFLKQVSSKSYPLFGSSVITAVLRAADEEVSHQGAEAIVEALNKQKYVFYDENGIPLDQKTTVDEHVRECLDCSHIQRIKEKTPPPSGHLLQIPVEVEYEVLLFADRRHQGFAEAFKRVKTWADFPDFKSKVT